MGKGNATLVSDAASLRSDVMHPNGGARSLRPERRTQAQRRTATRDKVVQAARQLLYSQGYTGTTTTAIRDTAGISTGALLGQFPTKASVMAAVVQESFDARKGRYLQALLDQSVKCRIEKFIDISIESCLSEDIIIITEILLAKRNDTDLSLLLDPILRDFDRWLFKVSETTFLEAGISARDFEIVRFINNSFIRGSSLEILVNGETSALPDILRAWKSLIFKQIYFDDVSRGDNLIT